MFVNKKPFEVEVLTSIKNHFNYLGTLYSTSGSDPEENEFCGRVLSGDDVDFHI